MGGNLSLSMAEVAVVGYEVCRGEGPEAGVALWRPVDPGTGRALFAWRAVGARPLILGVPYPVTESPTMTEGVLAFTELSARALIVGATNRCASTASSDCDGTTAACGGGQQPYRDSDMEHILDSVYQIAHEFLSEVHEDDLVVTLRGFSAFGVSISDGTTDPSSAETPAARFGLALADVMTDQYVSSCNDWPGASLDQRACGEDSVQGRYVNESPDPCTQVAPTASGRFIHVAQSDEVLGHMDEVVEVLGSILPED
jgi:hypothetical protein